ncbi:MAG: hypothetical protein DI607_13970, partial [Sphingomonas hengshuiensis]
EHIEVLRREKVIGSSLEANIEMLFPANPYDREVERLKTIDLKEVLIVASATVGVTQSGDFKVTVTKTTNHKCGRCWRLLPEVTADGELCGRCAEVVA